MAGSCRCKVALFKSAASQDDSEDRYVKKLNENHFNAITVPTLSFQFQLEELKKCLSKPEKYSGLILTSQRSVECVKEALPNLPVCWDERRHYCVGLQTRDSAAQLLGLSHLIGYDCGNAENLSRLIVSEFRDGNLPLLFPCSSLKLDTLPRSLEENRIPVEIVNSYVTVPHPELKEYIAHQLNANIPECLVFFSPSGVNFSLPFLRRYEWMSTVKIISIGNTTARALEEAHVMVDRICAKPTPESLIDTLKSLFTIDAVTTALTHSP